MKIFLKRIGVGITLIVTFIITYYLYNNLNQPIIAVILAIIVLLPLLYYMVFHHKDDWIENLFGTILFIGIYMIYFGSQPKSYTYVPNVITGLSTLSGIITAFSIFWITYSQSNKSKKFKEHMQTRLLLIVGGIGGGLLWIWISYIDLLYSRLDIAWKENLFGSYIIVIAFIELIYLSILRENVME